MPAAGSDENSDPSATATVVRSSLEKHACPSTPKSNSTPNRERFLREITMSPATPPCTPDRGRSTPARACDSPAAGRQTPIKKSQSPIKLEVGQAAFYFAIELPASKITPKKSETASKSGTPKRGGRSETPTGRRTPSPLKNATPAKQEKGTPTRKTRSPLKANGLMKQSPVKPVFATPTKAVAPKRDSEASTPTKKTPSPRKNTSPTKQSPARALFGTPAQKDRAEMPNDGRPGSPVKRAIELDSPSSSVNMGSRLAKNLVPQPVHPLRISDCFTDLVKDEDEEETPSAPTVPKPSEDFVPIKKTRLATKPPPENIGQLMASLSISSGSSSHSQVSTQDEIKVSPVSTPLRRASQKLQLTGSPSFQKFLSNSASDEPDIAFGADVTKEGPLTPLVPNSREVRQGKNERDETASQTIDQNLSSRTPSATETVLQQSTDTQIRMQPTCHLPDSSAELFGSSDTTRKVRTPQYQSLHFPKPASNKKQLGIGKQLERHIKWQEVSTVSRIPRARPVSLQHRVGTDPGVILKMQDDMASMEKNLRRSSAVIDTKFCGPLNLSELPPIPDRYCIRDQQDVRSPGAVGTPRTLSRADSNLSSITAIAMGSLNAINSLNGPSTPSLPMLDETEKARVGAARRLNTAIFNPGRAKVLVKKPILQSAASIRPGKSTAVRPAPSRKPPPTPVKQVIPVGRRNSAIPQSRIPSATPANPKIPTATTSAGAPRRFSQGPAARKTAALTTQPVAPKSTHPIYNPATVRKPLPRAKAESCDPSLDPRQFQQKVASAMDIADRLARWHGEDRQKADLKRAKLAAKMTDKKAARTPMKFRLTESTTPEGSPPKMVTPIKQPASPLKPTRTPSPTKERKPRPPFSTTPKHSPLPKTKAKSPELVFRKPLLKNNNNNNNKHPKQTTTTAFKTAGNRRIPVLDRNALRTPSKEIVSSLDKAIDQKIEEDARSGMEFTPSGNRVKDLLDARARFRV
ncbi:hypothetical protein DDE83_002680 [Stemphylium lycopersici]|uniref:Uncharacterized protein n=1 Tax=Stemphylium lycopersici TaxID=183478 RepID=A0A364N9G5_STELY|nr:hypothetical protein DDE83_002680 [Stemphylium lycopersici]